MKILKPLFIILISSFFVSHSYGQIEENFEIAPVPETIIRNEDSSIFVVVEQTPEFPGGNDSLFNFIRRNIIYPQDAMEKGIEGTVYIKFVVERDGSLSNFKLLRGVHPSLDAEALRVIKLSPKWKPGKQRNVPVRSVFNMPIKFKLNNANQEKTPPTTETKDSSDTFNFVEKVATFPGGEEAWAKFISENLIYPKKAKSKGIEGTVYISFIIEADGKLTNIKVVRGVDPLLDAEAIRVISLSPNWIPSEQRGKKVRTAFNMPIKFTLKKRNKKKSKH